MCGEQHAEDCHLLSDTACLAWTRSFPQWFAWVMGAGPSIAYARTLCLQAKSTCICKRSAPRHAGGPQAKAFRPALCGSRPVHARKWGRQPCCDFLGGLFGSPPGRMRRHCAPTRAPAQYIFYAVAYPLRRNHCALADALRLPSGRQTHTAHIPGLPPYSYLT